MLDIPRLGEIIKSTRKISGINQSVLSTILKVSVATISELETGKVFPSVDLYNRIVDYVLKTNKTITIRDLDIAFDVARNKVDLTGMDFDKKILVARLASVDLTPIQIQMLHKFLMGNIKHAEIKRTDEPGNSS